MAILESTLAPSSDAYKANRAGMLALISRMRALEERTRAASAGAKDRFHKRGQLLPRERVALVLDPGAPFIELSTLAGYMFDVPDADKSVPGGGVIAGIGFVAGVRCMVSANDSGIDAGALQAYGLDKTLRVQELALENKLPYVQLVESAGANLLRYRVEDFVRGGNIFRNLARLSAAGLPVVTVTHGSSTAGGAYQTGLSDYIVMVRGRTRAFLAGPPLLKAATGEIATEEELGGAEMHTSISGLGDYLAEDDRDALRIARDIMANLEWDRPSPDQTLHRPPRHDPEELLGIMAMDHKRPVDMRQVIARIIDDSDFIEFGANYGPATVCGHARIEGQAIGIITNNGPLDPAGANKATHFIQACCQSRTPLLYLNNTTGYMVGRAYEEAGMIKHGSKMIQAVTSATVPQITIYCGASFGAGNYGMCGRGFHPRFCFSWPNAKTAVMGGEQAAETMAIVTEAAAIRRGKPVEKDKIDQMKAQIIGVFDGQMDVFSTSARVLDDGVIDPRDTRAYWPRCWRSAARPKRASRGACSFRSRGHERRIDETKAVPRHPDRQSRRDRAADHADRAPSRLWRGRGLFGCRPRCTACARRGSGHSHRRGVAGAILSQDRGDHGGRESQRRRRCSSGLRLSGRERRFRPRLPGCGPGVYRAVARSHQGDGQQGRRQDHHAGGGRTLCSRLSRRRSERRGDARGGEEHRISGDDQGRRRRRRSRHAAGHGCRRRSPIRCAARDPRRRARSAIRPSFWSAQFSIRATLKSRCSATRSAMPSISASAIARCSAGIRN